MHQIHIHEMFMEQDILKINNFSVEINANYGKISAVKNINLLIKKGFTLGLVGESGCGKTVLSKSIMRLNPENKVDYSGEIIWSDNYDNKINILNIKQFGKEIQNIRGNKIGMVFQEPNSSLSMVHTVGDQIEEGLKTHTLMNSKEIKDKTIELIGMVGIPNPKKVYHSYPFELSGGMKQRVVIAMAIICQPKLLIADEPTTALDVTVEADILRLLKSLKEKYNMSMMIISHDLGVIAKVSDYVAVMYMGRIVEYGNINQIFNNAKHPYTKALQNSMPKIEFSKDKFNTIAGSIPDPFMKIEGCEFYDRCENRIKDKCNKEKINSKNLGENHIVRCINHK